MLQVALAADSIERADHRGETVASAATRHGEAVDVVVEVAVEVTPR